MGFDLDGYVKFATTTTILADNVQWKKLYDVRSESTRTGNVCILVLADVGYRIAYITHIYSGNDSLLHQVGFYDLIMCLYVRP